MNCHQCHKNCHSDQHKHNKHIWWRRLRKQHSPESTLILDGNIALVGMPNVGKSVLFNRLTGMYVDVSNYPGTTVEVSKGIAKIKEYQIRVIDTPGMYSLVPISEEEQVARNLLLHESLDAVVHVVDAKNLGRMLPLTFQLMEAGLSVILAINMIDEAEQLGLKVQREALQLELDLPVALMSATLNRGIRELKHTIIKYLSSPSANILDNWQMAQ